MHKKFQILHYGFLTFSQYFTETQPGSYPAPARAWPAWLRYVRTLKPFSKNVKRSQQRGRLIQKYECRTLLLSNGKWHY